MTLFNSTDQFKAVVNLVASAFKTKRSKASHKLAQAAGFKSDQALKFSIANNNARAQGYKEKTEIKVLNSFYKETDFIYHTKCDRAFQLSFISDIKAPLYIKLMLDGFNTNLPELLLKKLKLENFSSHSDLTFQGMIIEEIAELEENNENTFHFATLMQKADPNEIVTDLVALNNKNLVTELIMRGSAYQLNYFSNNPKIIHNHGLEYLFIQQYYERINFHYTHFSNDVFTIADPLDFFGTDLNDIIALTKPNSAFFTAEVVENIDSICDWLFTYNGTQEVGIYRSSVIESDSEEELLIHGHLKRISNELAETLISLKNKMPELIYQQLSSLFVFADIDLIDHKDFLFEQVHDHDLHFRLLSDLVSDPADIWINDDQISNLLDNYDSSSNITDLKLLSQTKIRNYRLIDCIVINHLAYAISMSFINKDIILSMKDLMKSIPDHVLETNQDFSIFSSDEVIFSANNLKELILSFIKKYN